MPLLEGDEPFSVFSSADSRLREERTRRGRVDFVWTEKKVAFFFHGKFPPLLLPPILLWGGGVRRGNEVVERGGNVAVALTLTHICIREIEKVSFWSCVKINSRKFLNFWTFVEIFFFLRFLRVFNVHGCPISGRKLVDFEKFNYSNKLVVQNSLEM